MFYVTHVQSTLNDDFSFTTLETKRSIFEVPGKKLHKMAPKKETKIEPQTQDLLQFKVEKLISELDQLYKTSDFAKRQTAIAENPDAFAIVPYEPSKVYEDGLKRSFEIFKASQAFVSKFQ